MANSEDVPRPDFMETLTGLDIPDDLIINSLLRLPVKPLLRCKAVSKAWLSLISNPTFVASHLRRASENNESFIIHRIQDYYNSLSLCHVDACSTDHQLYFESVLSRDLFIVGSYNGIVCAVLKNRLFNGRKRDFLCSIGWNPRPRSGQPAIPFKFHIFFWNPATKQCNLIPPLISGRATIYLGFGFNPIANDYKVVRLEEDKKGWVDAEIYSTNTNSWKYIESPPNVPRFSVCDACVNGVVYWPSRNGMITFDLNDEVFCDYKIPANVENTRDLEHGYMKITEMKDSLAVVMYSNDEEGVESKVNLWTVDNEIEEPWTLKFSFDVAASIDYVHGYIYNSGDILFKSKDGGWLLHNSDKKETENVMVSIGTSETFRHTESLVSIAGSEQISEMLTKIETEDQVAQVCFS